MTEISTNWVFEGVVTKVEERFEKHFDATQVGGTSESAGKMEAELVSAGWWVVLRDWPIALRFGDLKPDILPGDTMIMTMTKRVKQP